MGPFKSFGWGGVYKSINNSLSKLSSQDSDKSYIENRELETAIKILKKRCTKSEITKSEATCILFFLSCNLLSDA